MNWSRLHVQGSRRNAGLAADALDQIAAGVRSAPEGGFRRLAEASPSYSRSSYITACFGCPVAS